MEVQRFDEPAAYAARVQPFLLRAPARHNLYLGLLDILMRHPATYPSFHLWVVADGDDVTAAAMQTPPHNVVLAEPVASEAVEAIVEAIVEADLRPPGVVGGVTEARAFAQAWRAHQGGDYRTINRQGIYELTTVCEPGPADGAPRLATEEDLPLLLDWHADFIAEAVPEHVGADDAMRRRIAGVVADDGSWFWEADGEPVSMTGASAAPPVGTRIGPVYTPPSLRGRGYATALVAHVSAHALAHGSTRCYLHTDLANPTSNAIYQRIGYECVCEATEIRFMPD